MAKSTTQESQDSRPTVRAGERAVLVSYHDYEQARSYGRGLDDYDILMRRPEGVGAEAGELSEDERWHAVPANKYLKHRATGWREAAALDDLPTEWRDRVGDRDPFPAQQSRKRGSA